jgi:small subunit ribosomal protein S20
VELLANIKSAKKRILVNNKKAERNKSNKTGVKTAIKKVNTAIEANDAAAAKEALTDAISKIEKATSFVPITAALKLSTPLSI